MPTDPPFYIGFKSQLGHRFALAFAPSRMLDAMDAVLAWWGQGLCTKQEAERAMDEIGAVCESYNIGRKVAAILNR